MSQSSLFDTDHPSPPTFPQLGLVTVGTWAAWAVFSSEPTPLYRYLLGRAWNDDLPTFVLGMCNPSIAGVDDDMTVTKGVGFAKRNGCGSLLVANAGAWIETHPRELLAVSDPIGPHNERMIQYAFRAPPLAKRVAAWGSIDRRTRERLKGSMVWMKQCGARWCLGTTKEGEPRHPSRLPYDTPLVSMVDGRPFP